MPLPPIFPSAARRLIHISLIRIIIDAAAMILICCHYFRSRRHAAAYAATLPYFASFAFAIISLCRLLSLLICCLMHYFHATAFRHAAISFAITFISLLHFTFTPLFH
jgi:hypothetical protein